MAFNEGEKIRWYKWPKGVYYEVMWNEGGSICLNEPLNSKCHPNPVVYDVVVDLLWIRERKDGTMETPSRLVKAIEHTRGEGFSVIVGLNPYTDHVSFYVEKYPDGTSAEIKEAFLAEAEKALLKLIEREWDADLNASQRKV